MEMPCRKLDTGVSGGKKDEGGSRGEGKSQNTSESEREYD